MLSYITRKSITSNQINLKARLVNMNLMLMYMKNYNNSNDFGNGTRIRNEKIIDNMVDEIIDNYLHGWDPYDFGR